MISDHARNYSPAQKRAALDRLYEEWLRRPDLRLGQLVYVLVVERHPLTSRARSPTNAVELAVLCGSKTTGDLVFTVEDEVLLGDPNDRPKERSVARLGYWPPEGVTWPVDESWDPKERDAVVVHLLHPTSSVSYRGTSTCRACGAPNGNQDFSDGTFEWPSGLAHYLVEHGLRAPEDFVRHVLKYRQPYDHSNLKYRQPYDHSKEPK